MPTNPSPAPCWHQRTCPEPRSWPGALEAAAADASAGDPDEGLYWPGSTSPVELSSPLHLHKCWPGTYTVILAVVPPCAGECRSVRVTSVLIFARAPGLCCLCVGPTPGRPGTSARSRIAPRPPLRASRTRHLACRHRRAGPGRTMVPHRNAAHRQTRRRRTTRTLGRTTARTRRDSPSRQHTGPPPAATHAVPTAHHPRLRIAKRNACSACQSHAERLIGMPDLMRDPRRSPRAHNTQITGCIIASAVR